ncbi:MAG: DUF4434 domain-containing protein [Deltaproteobacteria bacterium]|nr:DUF4434 domain-containing protein [Deltaproteobacteria bacterium]
MKRVNWGLLCLVGVWSVLSLLACGEDVCKTDDDCTGDQVCVSGRCEDPVDLCFGLVCDSPPPDECLDSSRLLRYADQGLCDDGECRYSTEEEICEGGCQDGHCLVCQLDDDCDDADLCNGVETCFDAQCFAGEPLDCDDQDLCTQDTCDPVGGCAHADAPDGTACGDQMACLSGVCLALDPCGTPDLSVPYPYVLSGFWAFGAPDACDWRRKLTRMHRLGGDTVIQFGPRLAWGDASSMPDCQRDGKSCYQAVLDDLKAVHAGNLIETVYEYTTYENFGSSLLTCPVMDRRIEVGGRLYLSILLRHDNPADRSCDFGQGMAYDLLLIQGRPSNDSVRLLLEQAQIMGMQVFLGLPAPAVEPSQTWNVSAYARDTSLELSKRILTDYAERYAGMTSWQGVYQGMEAMIGNTPNSVLSWYSDQHAQMRSILPSKQIMISPYWVATISGGSSVATAKQGIKTLAQRNIDIIAPQDGVGTAKSKLFWPFEDAGGYYATTTDYYRAAREALDELGNGVLLWANAESFDPGLGPCYPDLKQTTKERMDKAIMFNGNFAEKLISYKWENFVCDGGLGELLVEQIEADWQRPLITQAFRWDVSGEPGIVLRGYHISSDQVNLTYYDGAWQVQDLPVPMSSGSVDPNYGANHADQPDRLQEVWIPFHWTNLAPSFWVHISVVGPGGSSHHNYSLGY